MRTTRYIQVFAIRVDRRITSRGCLLMIGVIVGGTLVFDRRVAEIAVLQQQVGKLIVDLRRLFVRKA